MSFTQPVIGNVFFTVDRKVYFFSLPPCSSDYYGSGTWADGQCEVKWKLPFVCEQLGDGSSQQKAVVSIVVDN